MEGDGAPQTPEFYFERSLFYHSSVLRHELIVQDLGGRKIMTGWYRHVCTLGESVFGAYRYPLSELGLYQRNEPIYQTDRDRR